jgi:hypothetical protein
MDLFIVRHQHSAECCLAADPYSGAKLLNYLNQPNARKNGIGIRGEAIVRGEHTLYLIVEAIDEARLREFMQPFAMAAARRASGRRISAGTIRPVAGLGGAARRNTIARFRVAEGSLRQLICPQPRPCPEQDR